MTERAISSDNGRVLGWDLLRGFCAFAVLAYHLLIWQGVAEVHTLGTYGVYIFFVLSGASLAYAYGGKMDEKRFSMRDFLLTRYARLAPLYLALMLVVLPWKLAQGGPTLELLIRTLANAAFVFGLYNPASHSMLVGGWSLGIEALFYLAFPLVVLAARSRWALSMLALSVLAQLAWIALVFSSPGGYGGNLVLYHQFPAFFAYFVGGVFLGLARRTNDVRHIPAGLGVCLVGAAFAVFVLLNPPEAGDQLTGARGLLLFSLCFLLVWFSGAMAIKSAPARRAAGMLGDATYGLYLIHPVLFFGLTFAVLPRLGVSPPVNWTLGSQMLLLLATAIGSFTLALLSERFFERPIRAKARRLVSPRPQALAADASSDTAALAPMNQ